jgi:NAD(P)-dependent dehydrogenase (short-subunit alcohol dehydrogenase family)
MEIDIQGKVVVVTGAAQGIGRTLALGLAAEGARVAVLARDRKRAQLVVDEIGALADAPPALAVEADVGDESAMSEAAAEIDRAWGRSRRPDQQRRVDASPPAGPPGGGLPAGTGDALQRVAAHYPGGRIGQPEDLVALTAFLCSEAASHLSGSVIFVRRRSAADPPRVGGDPGTPRGS